MGDVSISTQHHQLKAYLTTSAGQAPWSSVIVLHEVFGLTGVSRGHADWLAKEGYLSVASDLLSCGGRNGAATRPNCALERRQLECDVKGYLNAGRSFLGDRRGLIRVLGAVLESSYRDEGTADARGRIRTFLRAPSRAVSTS